MGSKRCGDKDLVCAKITDWDWVKYHDGVHNVSIGKTLVKGMMTHLYNVIVNRNKEHQINSDMATDLQYNKTLKLHREHSKPCITQDKFGQLTQAHNYDQKETVVKVWKMRRERILFYLLKFCEV